jgi:polar amino acid transport system permease protein
MSVGGQNRSNGESGPATAPAGQTPQRRFRAGAQPRDARMLATLALAVAAVVVLGGWATLLQVWAALRTLDQGGLLGTSAIVLIGAAAALPLIPATRSLRLARRAAAALAAGDRIAARVGGAAARSLAWITFGVAAAEILAMAFLLFLIANDLAVSRTFFFLPLIADSFFQVLRAFKVNVYIFLVSEVLVLIWGLAVALARLAPGPAGRPIRAMATLYVDVFRGLPAVINVYLIGFGIPLTGLPILKDMSQESFAILALTLTSGAYVAEIYRAGIESIHWSQTAAARSLGLSYVQTLRFVVVPQGVRHIIPPLLNSFIALQKDTALVSVIGTIDGFNQSMIIASNKFNLSAVTTVAILFIIITIPQARLVDRLIERHRLRIRVGGS